MRKVVVRNERGAQKELSEATWNLMKSSKEQGNTRKGWTLVGEKGEVKAPAAARSAGAQAKKEHPFVVVPPEIAEAAKKAEDEKLGGMIAGTKPQEATPASAPAAAQEDAGAEGEAPAPTAAPPAAQTNEQPKADNLAALPQLGPKAQEALNAAGIYTYAQLAATPANKLNAVLEGAGMGPKKAQVPGWIGKAKDLAAGKKPTTNTED